MERLRHIREQAGYSQQDLADASDVSQHTISEIELGRRKPQGRTLRKLAKVLGVEVRDFFEEARPLGQAPHDDYAAHLKEKGFPSEQIAAYLAQNERDKEFIARELEKMSDKERKEALLKISPRIRKYYRENPPQRAARPESESA